MILESIVDQRSMTNIWVTGTIKIGPIIGFKVQMRAHMLPSLSFLIFHGDVSRRGLFPPIFRPSQGRQCGQCREIHTVVIFKPVRIEQPMQLHFSVIQCTACSYTNPLPFLWKMHHIDILQLVSAHCRVEVQIQEDQ